MKLFTGCISLITYGINFGSLSYADAYLNITVPQERSTKLVWRTASYRMSRNMQAHFQSTKSPTLFPSSSPSNVFSHQPTSGTPKMINIVSEFSENNSYKFCMEVYPKKYRFKWRKYYYIVTRKCNGSALQNFYVDDHDQIRSKFKNKYGSHEDKCLMQRKVSGVYYLILQECYPNDKIVISSGDEYGLSTKDTHYKKVPTFPGKRPKSGIDVLLKPPRNEENQKWKLKEVSLIDSPEPSIAPTASPTIGDQSKIKIVSKFQGPGSSYAFCLQVDKKPRYFKPKGIVYYHIVSKRCSYIKYQNFYVDDSNQIRSRFKNKWGHDQDKCFMQRRIKGKYYLVLQKCNYGPNDKILVSNKSGGSYYLETKEGGKFATFPGKWPKSHVYILLMDYQKDEANQKWRFKGLKT